MTKPIPTLFAALLSLLLSLPCLAVTESTDLAAGEPLSTSESAELVESNGSQKGPRSWASNQEIVPPMAMGHAISVTTGCNKWHPYATDPYARVGATCSNARQNAADAARAAAVCPAGAGAIRNVIHSISTCSSNPAGEGYQATANATYECEFCILE